MPCPEDLWTATSWHTWHKAYKKSDKQTLSADALLDEERTRPSLQFAIFKLYQNLSLIHLPSSLSGSVLIYALVQRTQEIAKYFDDPLGIATDSETWPHPISSSPERQYLPAISSFTKWRNGACDYLDVLHWEAMANSARERGLEGPIFLKLHIARLLLLVPVNEMLALADHLTKQNSSGQWLPHHLHPCRLSLATCQDTILTWMSKDRFKARLAVIHAGGLFCT